MDAWSKDVVAQQGPLLFSLTFKFSLWGPQPRVKMPGLRSSLSSQGMKALVVMVASSLSRVPWLQRPATRAWGVRLPSSCLGRPPPVFAAGALEASSREGPRGASSPAARPCVLSSKPCSHPALPAKATRTFLEGQR